MLVAEFLGTALLTVVVLAVSKSNIGVPYFVALAAGLTLATMVMVFGAVSGAHLNPAITLGLFSARRIKLLPALAYVAAQLLGGIAAYLLYTYFTDSTLSNDVTFDSRVLVAEAAGAFILSTGIAAAVYQKLDGGRAAFTIGASLALGVMVAALGSGGVLNPAVALGLRTWEWGSYVLGPVLGAVIGFNLYALLFAPVGGLITKAKDKKK